MPEHQEAEKHQQNNSQRHGKHDHHCSRTTRDNSAGIQVRVETQVLVGIDFGLKSRVVGLSLVSFPTRVTVSPIFIRLFFGTGSEFVFWSWVRHTQLGCVCSVWGA